MIIIMKNYAPKKDIKHVIEKVKEFGFSPHIIEGVVKTIIGAVGDNKNKERLKSLITMPNVESIMPILQPYKLASRSIKKKDSIIHINKKVAIGGNHFVIIAGPCAVESEEQILSTAIAVKQHGGHLLRGGAFKPRTSPYSFQGLREEGVEILKKAKEQTGLGIVTELTSVNDVELLAKSADIIQIGARNMQNFNLLQEVGQLKKPILLKRGMSATIEEFLMSAEYILSEGNYNVILCERGIRTFETAYRNTLDLNAIPALKLRSHLPVIVDPSHGTGQKALIPAMSKAAIGAGADGLMIEVHPKPEEAFSDGPQSLTFDEFSKLMEEIEPFIKASGKKMTVL